MYGQNHLLPSEQSNLFVILLKKHIRHTATTTNTTLFDTLQTLQINRQPIHKFIRHASYN